MRKILFIISLIISINQLQAQVNPVLQQQARSYIASKGLDENEVKARLKEKGIDIDNVTPEQLPQLQSTIESVIAEMEQEKKGAAPEQNTIPASESAKPADNKAAGTKPDLAPTQKVDQVTLQDAVEIQEKVKTGVSVEEAVSEKITDETQEKLPPAKIYGHQFFRDQSIALFRTTNEVKPPDSYILSTGDVITISVFGVSQFDSQFEINKDGYIQPSGMPKMFLKGISLGQAKELLRNRFNQYYRFAPEQFAVSLTTARTISVNIFGETNHSGTFTMSAINTAFNALVAAGGPSDIGSLREIKVIRGKNTKVLDVYRFLNDPTIQYDFFLEDNDIIYVPVSKKVVSVTGAVRRAFKYELKESENLTTLIDLAGGLNANAYREVIQLKRFVNDEQVLIDIDLKNLLEQKTDFPLVNGDEIIVRAIPTSIENTASISGAVELPGKYSLEVTPKLSDLIKRGVLRRGARTDAAFLLRRNPDGTSRVIQINIDEALTQPGSAADLALQQDDQLTVYAQSNFIEKTTISVGGAVRKPLNEFPFSLDSSITLYKAVLLAGGLKPEANGKGYIIRTNPNNPTEKVYEEVDLAAAVANPQSASNINLQPLDQLVALSVLSFSETYEVGVNGAVRKPGAYPYGSQLTLQEAIVLSNGLAPDANGQGYIVRTNINNNLIKDYIPVDIAAALRDPSGAANVVLQPNDVVSAFSALTFTDAADVSVAGAVRNPGKFPYSASLRLKDLLLLAGGVKMEAATNRIDVYRIQFANNQPTKTLAITVEVDRNFQITSGGGQFQLQPFDEVVVRTVPDFEFQRFVEINGEVKYPGRYALISDNEHLANVVKRAGGLTLEADKRAATLYRTENQKGYVVTRLGKALRRPGSNENHVLKPGDVVNVPKVQDLVTIKGANTELSQILRSKVVDNNQINVAFHPGKRAGWYVRHYTGGFSKNANRRKITVEQPNGKINRTRHLGLFKLSPKVVKGSIVYIPAKPPKENKPEKEKKNSVDWDKKLTQIIAFTSMITSSILAYATIKSLN